MRYLSILILATAIFTQGCITVLTNRRGGPWVYFKGQIGSLDETPDTTRYTVQPFSAANYSQQVSHQNGKRLLEHIRPQDLSALLAGDSSCMVYLYIPYCGAAPHRIRQLDSIAKTGQKVAVVALLQMGDVIDKRLRNTVFANYPYYIIEAPSRTTHPGLRLVHFVKAASPEGYAIYKDEVMGLDYLLVKNNGATKVIYWDAPAGENVLNTAL